MSKSGGEPEVLASGLAQPGSIAVDDAWIYWINEGTGTIAKLPK